MCACCVVVGVRLVYVLFYQRQLSDVLHCLKQFLFFPVCFAAHGIWTDPQSVGDESAVTQSGAHVQRHTPL